MASERSDPGWFWDWDAKVAATSSSHEVGVFRASGKAQGRSKKVVHGLIIADQPLLWEL